MKQLSNKKESFLQTPELVECFAICTGVGPIPKVFENWLHFDLVKQSLVISGLVWNFSLEPRLSLCEDILQITTKVTEAYNTIY